jgi:hypothetical protein
MKRVILPKLVFLSVFTLWTIIGYSQENKVEIRSSSDTQNNKTSIKSDEGTVKNGFTIHALNETLKIAKDPDAKIITAGSNLLPYKPNGWDDIIVLSTVSGTSTSASTFNNGQSIYLDFAIGNNGTSDITQTFKIKLYIDDVFYDDVDITGLASGYYVYFTDLPLYPFSAGSHSFKIVADANNVVTETSETDNEYSRSITVTSTSPCTDLALIQPTGWNNKLVLSTTRGTNTDASTISDNDKIYVDWAVSNNGGCGTSVKFNVNILVDGVLKNTFEVSGLAYNSWIEVYDNEIGPFPAGSHTFKVVIDATNVVNEIIEGNNEYSRTFTISHVTGIESVEDATSIKIYPNPVSNEFFIEYKGNNERIDFEILNSGGHKIYSSELFEKTIVHTTSFAPGIYWIKFHNEKISGIKKVIIK